MVTPTYFHNSASGGLYRRMPGADRVWYGGRWNPTDSIGKYMVGENDDLEPITEERARQLRPEAFAGGAALTL